ncbi:Avr9/Cf-9 rapidly elicited protein [Rhynchospora pubera]|uniref:Avr9/Cf-9 rapidly elicited protein n=1 Tax=Rhynchospora pubera TaxID=906938 RepID=A0AAV8GWZ9_9POAL|nr:Avr9/Cf-9 rapidly elicited protein [Rhynchospora pubera]
MDKGTCHNIIQKKNPNHIWDCESTLYDSFELKSFNHYLSPAIANRSLSMPHLSALPEPPFASASAKKRFWLSKLFNKLFGKVFRLKRTYSMPAGSYDHRIEDYYYRGFYSLSGRALSSIPEVSDHEESPDIAPIVRKVKSERLPGTAMVELEMVL